MTDELFMIISRVLKSESNQAKWTPVVGSATPQPWRQQVDYLQHKKKQHIFDNNGEKDQC